MHIAYTQLIELGGVDTRIEDGSIEIRLDNLVNVVYALYAWGFDRSKVHNVRLVLDGVTYIDTTMALLEYNKKHDIDAMLIYLTQETLFERNYSLVNFSSIKNARLILTMNNDSTDCCIRNNIYVGAITDHILQYADGKICTARIFP